MNASVNVDVILGPSTEQQRKRNSKKMRPSNNETKLKSTKLKY